ncbi:MAG: hypothetical protein ACRC3H_07220 [Lachnospiraceae bacterium]
MDKRKYKIDGMVVEWENKVLAIKDQQRDLNIIAIGLVVIDLLNYILYSSSIVITGSIESIRYDWPLGLLLGIIFSYWIISTAVREFIPETYFSGGIPLVLIHLFAIGTVIFIIVNLFRFAEKAVAFICLFVLYLGVVGIVKIGLCCKRIILRKLIDYTRLAGGLYMPSADYNDKVDSETSGCV